MQPCRYTAKTQRNPRSWDDKSAFTIAARTVRCETREALLDMIGDPTRESDGESLRAIDWSRLPKYSMRDRHVEPRSHRSD
jgi:hypothetical protein